MDERYTILEALIKQIAQYFVKKIVFRYKCSEKFLSDKKLAFIRELMTEITHEMEIYVLKTSVFSYKPIIKWNNSIEH
jgi:hypothetical protein